MRIRAIGGRGGAPAAPLENNALVLIMDWNGSISIEQRACVLQWHCPHIPERDVTSRDSRDFPQGNEGGNEGEMRAKRLENEGVSALGNEGKK